MSKTMRLIYPQWQGGIIDRWIPELSYEDSSRGYYLGAKLLNMLAQENEDHKIEEVPVSLDIRDRKIKNGIMDYDFILKQTNDCLDILNKNNPDKIIVFGGECSVSVVPFTFLNKKYDNDVAVIWIDAHPDITLPSDNTSGSKVLLHLPFSSNGCSIDPSQSPFNVESKRHLVGVSTISPF